MLKKNQKHSEKCFKNIAYLLETQVNHEKILKNWEIFENFCKLYY